MGNGNRGGRTEAPKTSRMYGPTGSKFRGSRVRVYRALAVPATVPCGFTVRRATSSNWNAERRRASRLK